MSLLQSIQAAMTGQHSTRLVDDDVENIAALPSAKQPQCIVCNTACDASFEVKGYRYFTCRSCDFVFIDPASSQTFRSERVFTDDYFRGGGGAGYVDYLNGAMLLEAHGRRYAKLPALSRRPMRVLDVGCAAGFTLQGFIAAGCTGVGIEPNASMAAYAQSMNLDVYTSTLENFHAQDDFDLVVLLQVVDHVEDIQRAFERVATLTKPGGLCLIEFDDCGSLVARAFRSAWHGYAPPTVQRVFSRRSLTRMLGTYGFTLQSSGYAEKYLRMDHALAVLRYRLERWIGGRLVARLSKLLPQNLTVRYPGDDIKWAVFRKAQEH